MVSSATLRRPQEGSKPFAVRGSLKVDGSFEELMDEMRQIRAECSKSIRDSTEEMTTTDSGVFVLRLAPSPEPDRSGLMARPLPGRPRPAVEAVDESCFCTRAAERSTLPT
jgi:hypothetical protein